MGTGGGRDTGGHGVPPRTGGTDRRGDRGQSEVLGALLMVALALVFGALVGAWALDLGITNNEQTVAPQVSFGTSTIGGDLTIEHKTGSNLKTNQLSLVGSESGEHDISSLGDTWETGEKVTITPDPDGETVRIYWNASETEDSATLLEYRFDG